MGDEVGFAARFFHELEGFEGLGGEFLFDFGPGNGGVAVGVESGFEGLEEGHGFWNFRSFQVRPWTGRRRLK